MNIQLRDPSRMFTLSRLEAVAEHTSTNPRCRSISFQYLHAERRLLEMTSQSRDSYLALREADLGLDSESFLTYCTGRLSCLRKLDLVNSLIDDRFQCDIKLVENCDFGSLQMVVEVQINEICRWVPVRECLSGRRRFRAGT